MRNWAAPSSFLATGPITLTSSDWPSLISISCVNCLPPQTVVLVLLGILNRINIISNNQYQRIRSSINTDTTVFRMFLLLCCPVDVAIWCNDKYLLLYSVHHTSGRSSIRAWLLRCYVEVKNGNSNFFSLSYFYQPGAICSATFGLLQLWTDSVQCVIPKSAWKIKVICTYSTGPNSSDYLTSNSQLSTVQTTCPQKSCCEQKHVVECWVLIKCSKNVYFVWSSYKLHMQSFTNQWQKMIANRVQKNM